MSYKTILLEEEDGLAILTLNRPASLNALTHDMAREMNHALDGLKDSGSARALLMTGAGNGFCSGADLSLAKPGAEGPLDLGPPLEALCNPLIERLFALPIPIVTAVNGLAAGAGCALALCGDIVFAARSAYLLLAYINVGLVPDMGLTWILPRLAGRARASAMMMLSERIPAEQALDWGLLYKVVDDDALVTEARAAGARMAKGPTAAYRLIRHGLRSGMEEPLSEALRTERENIGKACATEDYAEGVTAFLEKRPARFKGC
jgi:2-(1,2-epoxy-1,2-dihydrophenyl)acetyl-CoA isomerase